MILYALGVGCILAVAVGFVGISRYLGVDEVPPWAKNLYLLFVVALLVIWTFAYFRYVNAP